MCPLCIMAWRCRSGPFTGRCCCWCGAPPCSQVPEELIPGPEECVQPVAFQGSFAGPKAHGVSVVRVIEQPAGESLEFIDVGRDQPCAAGNGAVGFRGPERQHGHAQMHRFQQCKAQ